MPGLNLFARFIFFPTHCCRVDTVHWILSTLFLPHISHPANATIDFSTTSVFCPFPQHQIITYSVIPTNHCSLESLTFVIVTKLLTIAKVQYLSIDFFIYQMMFVFFRCKQFNDKQPIQGQNVLSFVTIIMEGFPNIRSI